MSSDHRNDAKTQAEQECADGSEPKRARIEAAEAPAEGELERLRRQLAETETKYQEEKRLKEEAETKYQEEKKKVKDLELEIYEKSLLYFAKEPPKMELKSHGASDSNTGQNAHMQATSEEKEVKLEELLDSEEEPTEWKKLSSTFLSAHEKSVDRENNIIQLQYSSEADISNLVSDVLRDAIKLAEAKTGKSFMLHHEASIFSDRPDHVVVVDFDTQAAVLAVEDKKPFDKNIAELGFVLGQVYDYIMAMKLFGNSTPFAVLGTFEKSWLCWLDGDPDSYELASNQQARTTFLKRTFNDSPCTGSAVKETSPSLAEPRIIEAAPRVDDGNGGNVFIEEATEVSDRKLCISKAFEFKDLVRLLYTAILCGLCRNPNAPRHEINRYANGYKGKALRIRHNAREYTWGTLVLESNEQIRFQESTGSSTRSKRRLKQGKDAFYIIDLVGRGHTSKAFLAFNEFGKECVIKMYVKRDDKTGRILKKKDMNKIAKEHCNTEARNLKRLYPFFAPQVFCKCLNGFYCVIMPFLKPIKVDDRESYLSRKEGESESEIEKCLKHFESKGFQYRDEDVRWRHVGIFDGKVVLFDVAELIKKERKAPSVVQKHVGVLRDRLGDPKPTIPTIDHGVDDRD